MIRQSVDEIRALLPQLGAKGLVFFNNGDIRLLGDDGCDVICSVEGLEARLGIRTWRKSTMYGALQFAGVRIIKPNVKGPEPTDGADVTWFGDGCAIACGSVWIAADSDFGVDVDAKCPDWWIYS